MQLEATDFKVVVCVELAQDGIQLKVFVINTMNLRVP
jgi:hypothetical protein